MMFITVLKQVIILFILIGLGFCLAKKKIFSENGVKNLTDIVLLLVTPCVIIKSFIRPFDPNTLKGILLSFLAAFAVQTAFILISRLIFRGKDDARKRVLRFGVVFSNCGFMSLPLQEALLGENGVLYGASFIAIFNLIVWSYGILQMSGDKKFLLPKKLILNPGIIGLVIGLLIFLLSIPLPEVICAPVGYLAALNTPLPMLIIGYHLAQSDMLKALRDVECMLSVFIRLFLLPAIAIAGLYICGLRGELFISTIISCSAPTAAITTMFAAKFNKATALSVNMVSLSTLCSLISMPLLITLAQYLA